MSEPVLPRPARTAGIVVAAILGALLIITVAIIAWVGVRGALAYSHLRDAQAATSGIRADLSNPETAAVAIAGLRDDTSAAHSLTSDPIWRLAELTPWLGPQLSAFSTVAASLDDVVSTSLTPLADVAATFSADSIRPQGGRIDVSSFVSIQDAATTGAEGITTAAASVRAIDTAPLVAPLRLSVDEISALLDEAAAGTDALARATELLPSMLGGSGPRDYLVLFQNNAEWRSLGGIPGAMAVIHTDDGAMTLSRQASSGNFPRYDESILPLPPEVEAIYGQRPGRWIQNVTQVPDFTVAAPLAQAMWAREFGQQVDGVLALDPVALSYLLQATGPVTLPTGDVLTSDNAVSLLLNEVYLRYEDPAEQDAFFAAAASSVFAALSQGGADPVALLTALTRAGSEHRLLMWSAHPDEQARIAETTLAGALPETNAQTATFGAYLNDGTGSKMDYYVTADTQLTWNSCTLDAVGTATGTATLTLTLANGAPADAANLPSYITGGGVFGLAPGVARTVGYIYLPQGFIVTDSTLSSGGGFGTATHDGRQVLTFSTDLAPGASTTATVAVRTVGPSAPRLIADVTPTITSTSAPEAVCTTASR
ncbi:DUF4012 domain-containing protein [Microbacterium rhizomatis]|uniref:DUF4012 domain-containing protein n=1 Tax=Microbacterium rhizomatis TaxID=1631477 RepID=A0A5J5IZG9_9MICO|nr:DUF4012 domain-containing protein [Microbacterium rhizomatis]KAA9107802.1 DUF4012 domain-containing protein [Microbacterium rhizomatis]